jgi:preprotein translocase subunit Sec63
MVAAASGISLRRLIVRRTSTILAVLVESIVFIVVLLVGIFAFDLVRRWWRENEYKRRWRERDDE